MHPGLHVRQIRRVLIEHEPYRLVAVFPALMPGSFRPRLALRHEIVGPYVVIHLVRVGRVRPLPEHPEVIRVHVERKVRKNQVMIIVGELIVVEFRIVLPLLPAACPFLFLDVAADVGDRLVVVGRVDARAFHDDLDRIGNRRRLAHARRYRPEWNQIAVVP